MIQGFVHPEFSPIADELARMIPADGRSGAAISVYHQGECVVDLWGGCRDRAGNPWERDTLALSFSTTKGVESTLLHVLADQGLIDYNQPVKHYWPEFCQGGKSAITVAHLLTHQAGLYDIRSLIDDASRMTDWEYMAHHLAAAAPCHAPGSTHGYHGLTYGWLLGELIQRVTGQSFAQVLKEQLADPLQLDGLYVGLPEEEFGRRAMLRSFPRSSQPKPTLESRRPMGPIRQFQSGVQRTLLKHASRWVTIDGFAMLKGLVPHGIARLSFNDDQVVSACIPSANGMFTARSLARMYAMMANGGELDGVRLMSPQRVALISQVRSRRFDKVVPLPMHWRLGYHRVFTTGPRTPNAFGHFGFQGSGAWCDPSRQLSLGFTVNSTAGSTPFGDARIAKLSARAIEAVERMQGVRVLQRAGAIPYAS
ncbi:predicted beta-lactamase protein [gamma proteobacterium HdN1]|nr:predicted beta-lactamase protein [gamma proteobacterium HdN1]